MWCDIASRSTVSVEPSDSVTVTDPNGEIVALDAAAELWPRQPRFIDLEWLMGGDNDGKANEVVAQENGTGQAWYEVRGGAWVAHVVLHRDHMLVFQQERHVLEGEPQWAAVETGLGDVAAAARPRGSRRRRCRGRDGSRPAGR